MPCCGKRSSTDIGRYRSFTRPAVNEETEEPSTVLRYRGTASLILRGPRTGRAYAFSPAQTEQSVSNQDVEILLRTKLFTRVA